MSDKKYIKVTDVGVGTDLPRVGDKIGSYVITSIKKSGTGPHKIKIRYPKN